jgi:hypothetical protein
VGCALVLSVATPAAAHFGHVVVRAERYLKLDVNAAGARLVVSVSLGPEEMARIQTAADADGDGNVSEPEKDAYMNEWATGLATELPVTVDDVPVPVRWAEPFFEPTGAVRPEPGTVEMVGTFDLAGGEHAIAVRDAMRIEPYDRTDVAFRARDPAVLLASGIGDASPTELVAEVAYGRELPASERVLRARARLPEAERTSAIPIAVGVAVAIGVLAVVLFVRRRKR